MGRVFSPEQITNHQIPVPGANEKAGRFVMESLFESPDLHIPLEDGSTMINMDIHEKIFGLCGGMVYGSTALGCTDLRSDLDILITYYGNDENALPTLRDVIHTAEARYHVSIDPHLAEVGSLRSPLQHGIDPLFARHLIDIQYQDEPRWSYNWPVDSLDYSDQARNITPEQARVLAIRYTSGKARMLARSIVDFSGKVDYHAMQRALELPAALGRKVLAATEGVDQVDQSLLQDKPRILRLLLDRLDKSYTGFMGDPKVKLQKLAAIDDTYSTILDEAIAEEVDINSYNRWLHERYLPALNLGHQLSHAWVEILSRDFDKRKIEFETITALPYGNEWEQY